MESIIFNEEFAKPLSYIERVADNINQ